MNHTEFLILQKQINNMPLSVGFKFRVLACRESVRHFGAEDTKRKMIGNVYPWARGSSTEGGRIYLHYPSVAFNPSFYYTDLELVIDASNKLMIPIEPQKLDYRYEEYTEIFDK
jgi:hypothetical protein